LGKKILKKCCLFPLPEQKYLKKRLIVIAFNPWTVIRNVENKKCSR